MTTRRYPCRWLTAALVLLVAARASGQTGPNCGGPVVEKCIVSVTSTNPSTPATLTANLQFNSGTGAFTIAVKNTANVDQFELSPALTTTSTVTVVFKLANGGTDPKIAVSTGLVSSWSINTAVTPHQVTVVAQPRTSSWNRASGCTPSSCANTADVNYSAFLLAGFDPMNAAPASFASKFTNGFIATNGQYFDPFPSYNTTTKELSFKVGAPHFKVGGVTLNSGFARIFVPEAVITDLWGIAGGSAALASNSSLTSVTVGGVAQGNIVIDQASGGALVRIGETVPFGFSVPTVVLKPSTTDTDSGGGSTSAPSAIPDQTVSRGSSATPTFTVNATSLESVWGESSDYGVAFPSPREAACDTSGNCSITIVAGQRAGTAAITVTARNSGRLSTTTFNVTVPDGGSSAPGGTTSPSSPGTPAATSSGSGAVLTWSAPSTGAPARYAIAGGTSSGGNDLPVILTPDASTSYTIPALPSGTYYFRVYAVTDGALGSASTELSTTISNGSMPGFVTGVQTSVDAGNVTVTWNPAAMGTPPAYYWVEFGSSPGARDAAIVTSVARTYTRYMNPGTYWMRVRAIVNGVAGAVSNETSIVVAPSRCAGAPGTPTLLPVTSSQGAVTFSWSAAVGAAADRYRIELSNGTTLTTGGAGTSYVWAQRGGTFSAHVIADNACGSSARSNDVVFTAQP